MSLNGRHAELAELLEALCEDRLTPPQAERLEQLVLSDREARRFYLAYIDLHGTLYWDTAKAAEGEAERAVGYGLQATGYGLRAADHDVPVKPAINRVSTHRSTIAVAAALLAGCLLLAAGLFLRPALLPDRDTPVVADRSERVAPADGNAREELDDGGNISLAAPSDRGADDRERPRPDGPIPLTPRRSAILFAAIATLMILGAEVHAQLTDLFAVGGYTQAGILGMILFTTAVLGHALAERARASEALAEQRGVDLANLAQLRGILLGEQFADFGQQ
jgi:hypothetical protein